MDTKKTKYIYGIQYYPWFQASPEGSWDVFPAGKGG